MKLAGALLMAALGGCALAPVQQNAGLDEARTLYREAAADSQVRSRAPMELAAAERALAQAERTWRDKGSSSLVAHQAYLAAQRARLALATGQYRAAEAKTATSRNTRSRLLIEARVREAAEVRSRAAAETARATIERRADSTERTERVKPPALPQRGADPERLQSQLSDLKARQTERGWVVTLPNDVLFDGAQLKASATRSIEPLARFLSGNPDRDVAIEGFTDSSGSSAANRRLSESRAETVKAALVARGIEARRIEKRGYGPSFPVASNETPDGRQLNRRVEIIINPS